VDTVTTRSGQARSHHGALVVVCLVLLLTFLDNTIVTVVLADVQSELHASVNQLQWVVNGYALTFASLMLVFGSLGDRLGRRRMLLAGIAVFCAGSIVAATAQSADVLIGGRVIMGVGAAASEPGTLSMIRQLFTDRRARARAIGVWSAVAGIGLAIGPLVGGVLAGVWSWRAIFWFNVFFGLVAFVGAIRTLPESADPAPGGTDYPGFLLGAGGLAAATFATIVGESAGYATWWIAALYLLAVVALVAFVLVERRATNPVLNVSYFSKPAFAGANIIALTSYFGTFSIFFFVALYLQVVGSASGYRTAFVFVPMAAGMVLGSAFTGRWVAATGPRIPMVVGCVVGAAGILITDAIITPTSGIGSVGWSMAIAGIGLGITMVPVTSTSLTSIPAEHSGMAASTTNTCRELGAVAGVAILGSIVNGQLTVNLVKRLTAVGIPKSFQAEVVTAVTTGRASSGAIGQAEKNKAIAHIVNEVVNAAYGAFGTGLEISLAVAGALLLLSAVVAALTIHSADVHRREHRTHFWGSAPAHS